MANHTNDLNAIRRYYSVKSITLDEPLSLCCEDVTFDYFRYESDGDTKTVLYIAYKPVIASIEKALKELSCANRCCLIVKTKDKDYHSTLKAQEWNILFLEDIKKELENLEEPKEKQEKATAQLTEDLLARAISCLNTLRTAIESASKDFIRTTPLCTYSMNGKTVSFDLRDILLVGAVAQADILLTGKTGSGKTKLANAVMRGLFGDDGFYSKTMLPTMTPDEFMDIDFKKIKDGGRLTEAIAGIPALEKAGIVLNEVNRAPGIIQNMMIAFLDKEFEVQGKPVPMGQEYDGGKRYQLRILSINEGSIYKVENLDPAIRDRMTIEVPVDAFPQSREDVLNMLDSGDYWSGVEQSHFSEVVQLHTMLRQVPVSEECKRFLAYLAGMSYCIRAPRGNKESITLSTATCETCTHIGLLNGICFNVRAPSARIILQLQKIARAFALFRCWKYADAGVLQVEHQDIVEAAPFVLFSKLSLDEKWVHTSPDAHGDRWTAIKNLIDWVYKERFLISQSEKNPIYAFLEAKQNNSKITSEMLNNALEYITKQDPWTYNPAALVQEFKKMQGDQQ